ncbi:MAG: hypothetical protein HPY85_09395 [Anaerolineae bacterium]|nr:hypothetical protein [Anaerolineae bacterium]
MVMLFDDITRTRLDPARYSEPIYEYLNISGRKEAGRIRVLLSDWFSRYPHSEQIDLRNRFRSKDNFQHQGAFFELFLHELLLQFNCKIKLHPTIQGTNKTPDFLVESQENHTFYLEATVVTGESTNQTAAHTREDIVYDAIDRWVDSPDYFLALTIHGYPKTPPRGRQIASFINKQIKDLNYDEILRAYDKKRFQSLPCWHFEHDGWKIEIQPIPKKATARGKMGTRPIGTRMTGFYAADHGASIRDSVIDKGKRYGELNLPYIIAVNAIQSVDTEDIMEALFGKETCTISSWENGNTETEPKMYRAQDGVWWGPNGIQFTRVSGVLLVTNLSAWNIAQSNTRLFHNPWALRPCDSPLSLLPQGKPVNGEVLLLDGQEVKDIFSLPNFWPESEKEC